MNLFITTLRKGNEGGYPQLEFSIGIPDPRIQDEIVMAAVVRRRGVSGAPSSGTAADYLFLHRVRRSGTSEFIFKRKRRLYSVSQNSGSRNPTQFL